MRILRDTLHLLTTASVPGEVVDLPYEWGEPFDWESYMSELDAMLKEEGAVVQEWTPRK